MDEKSNEIIGEIETYRDKLSENLNDLESRVMEATNWRTHFDRHPYLFVGVAVGGGLLLSGLRSRPTNGSNGFNRLVDREKGPASGIIDSVKGALVLYGAGKAKELLGRVLPGFRGA